MCKIKRIESLDEIYNIYTTVKSKKNKEIINLSNWQVSNYYEDTILRILNINHMNGYIRYEYTYTIENSLFTQLKDKLQVETEQNIIITSNNTISILLITNLLKQLNSKKICIVRPSYFSVYESMKLLNILYDTKDTILNCNGMTLPHINELMEYDYIWITSPYFCSSIYYKEEDIYKLKYLQNSGKIIIVDEAYSYMTNNLKKRNFKPNITILSPNKAIGINCLKFSVIIYDQKYDNIFNHWVDVIHGNLSISNIEAIRHFLSNNYIECFNKHLEFINSALNEVKKVLYYYPDFKILGDPNGSMIMIQNSKIKFDIITNIKFYSDLMMSTNGYILPGYFHDYNDKNGFCFRINLCLFDKKNFIIILKNILDYLMKYY